jgi:serine/threonine-protein kinase
MSLEPGQVIDGKYRIVRLIGEGGMGAVYAGENVRINRKVAIKVLHAAYTGNQEVMQRFEREAQAAGRIGNDHILEVLDLGQLPDGDHFIIMEFLDGDPLSTRIKNRGRLTPREAAPVIRQMLEGLGAAHAAGIIHRDLKPDNIFILREKAGVADYVKIIDFGISKFNQLSGSGDAMKMTRTGAVMGTPYYMSPEQASGSAEADQRSDIYSVGVILYEAVTGRVPFDAGTFNQLMFKIVLSEVPPPETVVPDLDPAFSSIIAKAMARDLTQRFQTTGEFIRALDAWLQRGAAVSVPPVGDAATAGLLPVSARASMSSQSAIAGGGAIAASPGTSVNWASSQHDAPARKSPRLIAAMAAVGFLVMGGAAFAAYAVLAKKPEPPARSSSSVTPLEPAEAPAPKSSAPTAPASPAPPAAAQLASAPNAPNAPNATDAKGSERPIVTSRSLAPRGAKSAKKPSAPLPAQKPARKPAASSAAAPDFGY